MDGEKYLKERMNKMKKSGAQVSSPITLRVVLLIVILVVGWAGCNFGLKYVADHPELDCTRTEKPGEFWDARNR
jgi:hypothetical protein